MNYLLDTNVLSEVRKPHPDRQVLEWLDQVDEDRTHLSVITLGEIARGVALLDDGRRKTALAEWLAEDLPARFSGRVIPVDLKISLTWGRLMADAKTRGISLPTMDGWIAATAVVHDLTLVTRNTKDFRGTSLQLLDPWGEK